MASYLNEIPGLVEVWKRSDCGVQFSDQILNPMTPDARTRESSHEIRRDGFDRFVRRCDNWHGQRGEFIWNEHDFPRGMMYQKIQAPEFSSDLAASLAARAASRFVRF